MSRIRVYISGPITKGDRDRNFQQAAELHSQLLRLGFAVLNPMLSMKLPGAFEIPHEAWLASDLPWVECAEAIFRLPGESTGADMEVEHALKHEIPLFTELDSLLDYFGMGELP